MYSHPTRRLIRGFRLPSPFHLIVASSSSPSPYQLRRMAAEDTVKNAINNHKIVIFAKSYCPYCHGAKQLFSTNFPNADIQIFELDEMAEGPDIQAYLQTKTGQRTVPNIFINQEHIGGNDDVQALNEENKLAASVQA